MEEHKRRFPGRRVLLVRQVFSSMRRNNRDSGKLPKQRRERPNVDLEDSILETAESPTISVGRISDGVDVNRIQERRTLHDVGPAPFHVQTDQTPSPTDYIARVDFCHCRLRNQQPHTTIFVADEFTFNRGDENNVYKGRSEKLARKRSLVRPKHRWMLS